MDNPVPNLDFSAWAELPYPHSEPFEDAELSKQLLILVDKLRRAKAPLSGQFQRRPEYGIWGFGVDDSSGHLNPADEMGVLADYFSELTEAVDAPQEWLDNGPHCAERVTRCRGYIDVGLHLVRKFDGKMEVTVRSTRHGSSHAFSVCANQDRLQAAQDSLKMPHEPSEMEFQAQIIDVDLDRGIALSTMGVLQIHDPSVLVQCYDRIGQWCTIWVDTAASAIRIIVPELLKFRTKK